MKAVNGNIEEFNKLFQDTEVQLGMKTLASFRRSWRRTSRSSIRRKSMAPICAIFSASSTTRHRASSGSTSHTRTFKQKIGGRVAPVATAFMDTISTGIDVGDAKDAGMKKLGWGFFRRQVGPVTQDEWIDVLHAGGYDNA